VKERFSSVGLEAVGGTPEDFAAKIKSEMARMGKVIKDAGIRE
jgi:tripartite-type tricarboxylate transporter receptor subunit TctC